MATQLKLCFIYLILLSWCKAGLADGLPKIALLALSVIIIGNLIYNKFWLNFQNFFGLFFLLPILFIFIISYLNPSYNWLTLGQVKDLKFIENLSSSKNIDSALTVSKRFKILLNEELSKEYKLALFLDLKNSFDNDLINEKDPNIVNLLNECETLIKNDKINYLPSVTIRSEDLISNFYFFFFALLLGFLIKTYTKSEDLISIACYIIALNCTILSIVGIIQKINFVPFQVGSEILGVWEAPEPRYFFSSFTYKNHWALYALVSLCATSYLIFKKISIWGTLFYRSKEINFLIISAIPIILSIPYSGSRSGTFILSFLLIYMMFITLKYCFNFRSHLTLLILPLVITIVLAVGTIFLFGKNKVVKEMLNVSSMQLTSISEGKMPYRWSLWIDAWKTYEASPIFGHGYNSYSAINPKYQLVESKRERLEAAQFAHTPYIPLTAHAHNEYLEWMCEWGFIALVLFIAPLIIYHVSIFLGGYSPETKLLCLGSIAFFAYCLVDFPSRTPACLALVSLNSGLVFASIRSKR